MLLLLLYLDSRNCLILFRYLPGLCAHSCIYNLPSIVYAEFSWILLLQCLISLWHYSLKLCLVLSYEVADADSSIKNLEKEADRLLDKIKPIKELQDNLGKNISQIKELINQARKQANSVSPISQKKKKKHQPFEYWWDFVFYFLFLFYSVNLSSF